MAEVKDKVITVESLKSLHDYNKTAYVNITGDTMTGALIAPRINVKQDSWTGYNFYDTDNNTKANILVVPETHTDKIGQLLFSQFKVGTNISERYYLPEKDDTITSDVWYPILTGKNAVTISQGGTGASNGATGLKNLFASGNTVLSSYQYGDTLPSAGTKGRIFFKRLTDV